MIKRIYYKLRKPIRVFAYNRSKSKKDFLDYNLTINQIKDSITDRRQVYNFFHQYYWHYAPQWLIDHRTYFSKENRGFGEDAFHAFWYLLLRDYPVKNLLEIGVYRGQVISLWALIGKKLDKEFNIHAISPFEAVSDGTTEFIKTIDYYSDIITNFTYFNLPIPSLHKGLSTDNQMIDILASKKWDIIYIDGNHNYEVVKQDFYNSIKNLSQEGFIILDDSALYTDYRPPLYATSGHTGPSKLAMEIRSVCTEILSVGHNRIFRKLNG